ncbi:MAG: AbrB family transcriptional regulator [Rhodobacter sp.]|nr:AbrB family transcriptional regulator [Rhodobacter sp.]
MRPQILSIAVSLAGVAVFRTFNLPLPWLLGPMFACLIAALSGMTLKGIPPVSATMRTVLGVAVGASITPALLLRLGDMSLSLALVPPFVLLSGLIGTPYFHRLWGFDRVTSYYSAMPGGLQDMLVFGEEAGGNPRALSLIHATRVLILVTALPLILAYVLEIKLDHAAGDPAADIPLSELAIMLIVAIAGWQIAARVGLFGATILGPLILAAIASLSGILQHRPPSEAIIAAQFFIGFGVGVKYVGITVAEMRRIVLAGVGYTVILTAMAAAAAALVVALGIAPLDDAMLAFSPGGQAEMTVLAIIAGADLAYVVTHHLTRIVIVIIGAPLMARLFR